MFYSPEDLSVGMVGMSMDGIYGYSPEDALTDLVQNVVMVAMGQPPAKVKPATAPAASLRGKEGRAEKAEEKKAKAAEKKPEKK